MNIGAVILAGGSGKRLGSKENKIFTKIKGKTVLEHCVLPFLRNDIKQIVIVCRDEEREIINNILARAYEGVIFKCAKAGQERQGSCKNGIEALNDNITHVLIHDCARMLVTTEIINRCIEALKDYDAVIAAMPLKDTIKKVKGDKVITTPDRNEFITVQTPQCFLVGIIKQAHKYADKTSFIGTDDASLVEHMGKSVKFVEGSYENIKITTKDDIIVAENILGNRGQSMDTVKPPLRIGNGFDVHALTEGRKLILGGIEIKHEKGLLGHSDADVLSHAVMDAILGAAALGDIGKHFPDTDPKYKDANSIELLKNVMGLIKQNNYTIVNIDAVIMAQKPKLLPYIEKIRASIANACDMDLNTVSVKATTTEHLSFIGREEGIASTVSVLLYKLD